MRTLKQAKALVSASLPQCHHFNLSHPLPSPFQPFKNKNRIFSSSDPQSPASPKTFPIWRKICENCLMKIAFFSWLKIQDMCIAIKHLCPLMIAAMNMTSVILYCFQGVHSYPPTHLLLYLGIFHIMASPLPHISPTSYQHTLLSSTMLSLHFIASDMTQGLVLKQLLFFYLHKEMFRVIIWYSQMTFSYWSYWKKDLERWKRVSCKRKMLCGLWRREGEVPPEKRKAQAFRLLSIPLLLVEPHFQQTQKHKYTILYCYAKGRTTFSRCVR